jgi:hypothetical protein
MFEQYSIESLASSRISMEMESLIEEALSIPLEMHVEMQAGVVTTIFGGPAKDILYM